jgi:hypothetical protein
LNFPTEHSECYHPATDDEDGKFDCLGRQDENVTLVFKDTQDTIKYEELLPCTDNYNDPGIQCGSECVGMDAWCRVSRDGFSCSIRNSPQLCQNHTFWEDKDCGRDAKRCTGRNQQCFYPPYMDGDEIISVCVNNYQSLGWSSGYIDTCSDKSEQVFPINSTCDHDTYVDIICDLHKLDGEMSTICKNRTIPCTEGLKNFAADPAADPHNCRGSCAVPGPDCLACTNSDYFNCTKSGVCVHPSLLCDGHPQCKYGEDEDFDTCYDTLVENGNIKESATLKCPSIMYPRKYKICEYFVSLILYFQK